MSHIAINSSGEVVLATEVKDDFLRTGKLQEPFRCTFCDVGVRPCAFTRKDFAKEAYFAVDDTPHLSGCPYGAGSNWAGSKRYATRTLFGVTLFLPNELLARKTQPLLVPPGGPTVRGGAPIDVTTRTRNYGHLLQASSHAATSVLARVVEAWKEARSVCYQEAAKRKEKDEHRFVGDKLKQYELSLFGARCNYNNAFHKFVSPWSGAAIHYGMAKVASAPQGFTLTPVDIDGKTKRPFAGTVLIDARVFLDDQLSERTVSRLEEAETSGSVINWYGYGRLAQGPTLELTISDSSLLYIRDV